MTTQRISKTFAIGAALLTIVTIAIVLGPLVYTASPNDQDLRNTLLGPSREHPLGTDQYGRDVLARVLNGGRLSLRTAIIIVIATTIIGFAVGWLSSAKSPVGRLLTRVVDTALALPSMVIALAVVGSLGIGMRNLTLAFILVGWPFYARVIRSFVLERNKLLDIAAAQAHGVRGRRIFLTHVAPHAFRTIAIVAGLDLGYTLAALSGFSYLGLGAQAPTAEWGSMLRDGQLYFTVAPWFLIGPALGIGLTVLGTTLMTEQMHARGTRI